MSGAGKRWKPYPAYKNSGVEWLGMVPERWEVKRLKFEVDNINQKTLEEAPTTPFVALEHIESWTGKLMVDENSQSDGQPSCYQPGDILFCKLRPYLAKVHLAKVNGICTSELLVLRAQHDIFPKYLHHFLLSRDTIDCITASTYGAKMPRTNWEFIGNLPLPIPPLPEQHAIAAFLDQQCAQIDSLIEKKQRMLGLLDEKRRAVITQAVTRGLDPTVPMKDSGVEWLGMVPEEWEIFSLRRLFCVKSGDMTTSTNLLDEGFQVFGGNGFRGYFDKWNTSKGVIIIGRYGALCGNIKISPDRIWATEHAFRVFPFMVFDVHFMAFFLEHLNLNRLSTRAAQPGLNSEMVRDHLIALPNIHEQQAIADYLDAQCATMDSQRKSLEKSIELLREYRASLITHAVTGKIDVRDVAPLQ